ncbi:MAG TPA: succinyl-diaminopimelate desuccinylase [Solirubrobacteraceae bacterium]|jgi:succinyl-diaminopimelate desuccinylase|nr:succinyl-diaminopimelate desuccinylase [Solirubrobacteraceae bacterium]
MALTGIPSTDLASRLAEQTLELVDIASESRAERDIAEHVVRVLEAGGVPVRAAGDSCVLAGASARDERPYVLLAGHLDTVPAQANWPGRRIENGVTGLGASDMKGGVAVMLELALARAAGRQEWGAFDVGYVLFGREELPSYESALAPLLAREAGLREAELAIVLEPTANVVQAGCLGNIDATWTFAGRAGHSARPWLAENAIDRAVAAIAELHARGPQLEAIEGLEFAEVATVTMLQAGVARNVIPGECTANVNFRYSPRLAPDEAERALRERCATHGELELLSNSAGALPPQANPLFDGLLAASGVPAQAKQAWTPVAEFAAAGIEAVNLGPGDPALAHRVDERISTAALVRAYEILESFLCG